MVLDAMTQRSTHPKSGQCIASRLSSCHADRAHLSLASRGHRPFEPYKMGKTEADDTANAHINSAITTAKRLLEALDKWKFATDCDTPVITTGHELVRPNSDVALHATSLLLHDALLHCYETTCT
jgi:hypothetical protein